MYKLITEQYLPINSAEAWKFFSSPGNLSRITPPEMGFKILTELKDREIYEGMQIGYRVKPLLGIPLKWITRIGKTEPGKYFTDIQVRGPYKVWEHTHTFSGLNGGINMRDEVAYELPFGILGRLMHKLFVRRKLNYIFEYRRSVLNKMFVNNAA
jgi:ligand-binding SRPBCC domain-containing protein